MKTIAVLAVGALGLIGSDAVASGVSAYLPWGLEPALEARIEQVMILADQPVLKRPISVAALKNALARACDSDEALCKAVEDELSGLLGEDWSLRASIEGAIASDRDRTVQNRFGLDGTSPWMAAAQLTWKPSDYALVSVGGVAYDGRITPSGSMLSIGTDRAQLDLGYRTHWLSPFSDSSMLLGTHAPTMPAATLANSKPLTRFGIRYEFFLAEMSRSDRIAFRGGLTSGNPRLAGAHFSIEPARGWSIGVNRLLQFGGGARGGQSLGDLFDAFFDPGRFDNVSAGNLDNQFGNQLASVTSSFIFPARNPVVVYLEYAGEDTSRGRQFLLGNSALSAGIRFPRLADRFDLTAEISEWQNGWYVNSLYGDGLTNRGQVLGHWGGAMRAPGDEPGAQSAMIRLGWTLDDSADIALRYRTLRNESYGFTRYERAHELTLQYSRPFGQNMKIGASLEGGQDSFGESYGRLAGALHFTHGARRAAASLSSPPNSSRPASSNSHWFLDVGVASSRVTVDLDDLIPKQTRNSTAPHIGLGLRRAVTANQDLGVRLEVDEVDGHLLTAVRALDYRYRFRGPLAVNAFLGAARYDLATPAYGLWGGGGVSWRDIMSGWDLALEMRFGFKIARDDLLPSDPIGGRPDSFYDVESASLSLSRRF